MRACIISVRGEWMRLRDLWRSQFRGSLPAALGIVCELLALEADNSALGSGAAYVFVRNGGVCPQEAYLKAANGASGDGFGDQVSIFRDVIGPGRFGARLSYRLPSRENPSSAA